MVPIMGVYSHVDWPILGRPEVAYFGAPGDTKATRCYKGCAGYFNLWGYHSREMPT
jgi:hypothetical protein